MKIKPQILIAALITGICPVVVSDEAKPERPERPEQGQKPERPERPERPGEGDRPERPERPERPDGPLGGNPMAADLDGDGKLNKAEWIASAVSRAEAAFARLDADNDGFITPEEMRRGMQQMREGAGAQLRERGRPEGNPEGDRPRRPEGERGERGERKPEAN